MVSFIFLLLAILGSFANASQFTGRCGRLSHSGFSDSDNHNLKYRRNGEAVTATAVECPEYEAHLKKQAVELKQMIEKLEAKYVSKINAIVALKNGILADKKYMSNSYSCDTKTGDWKLNRQAVFACSSSSSPDVNSSNQGSFSKPHHAQDFAEKTADDIRRVFEETTELIDSSNALTSLAFENQLPAIPSDTASSEEREGSNCRHSAVNQSPINLFTYEAENTTGIYQQNGQVVDHFINNDFKGHRLSGYLKNGDLSSPMTFTFDSPIVKSGTEDLKCSHVEFNLQGSEHTLDGKTFDGEVQLHCWTSSLLETYDEALEEAAVKVFSFFIEKSAPAASSENKLFGTIIKSSIDAQTKFGPDFQIRLENVEMDFPEVEEYFSYEGSLTHARSECASKVSWVVFKQPISADAGQFKLLDGQNGIHAGYLDGQHHVQETNDRIIRHFTMPISMLATNF